jgi:hypothetical protein
MKEIIMLVSKSEDYTPSFHFLPYYGEELLEIEPKMLCNENNSSDNSDNKNPSKTWFGGVIDEFGVVTYFKDEEVCYIKSGEEITKEEYTLFRAEKSSERALKRKSFLTKPWYKRAVISIFKPESILL